MPTVLTHAVVPLAVGLGLGAPTVSRRLLVAGVIASFVPDLDVVAFKLGIAYADAFGHRGASHSLLFAVSLAAVAALFAHQLRSSRLAAFAFIAVSCASHTLLDALTNGGLGTAMLWPWTDHRFFYTWRPIEVSPIGVHGILSARGLAVFKSELLWVWLPATILGLVLFGIRRAGSNNSFKPKPLRGSA